MLRISNADKGKGHAPTTQGKMLVDHIKQQPGPLQVTRSVYVKVPGKHFPALAPTEQLAFYKGTAVEAAERHKFPVFGGGLFEERSLVADCL